MDKGDPKTIDCTPTWRQILPTWLMIAADAYREGKLDSIKNFESEMARMAMLADLYNEHAKRLEARRAKKGSK